jgi:hypothetical protein
MPRRLQNEQAQPSPTEYAPEKSRADRYAEKQMVGPSVRTVTVACKVPTGLRLQLETPQKRIIAGRDGDEMVTFNIPGGKVYYVHGPALPRGGLPEGFTPPIIVGGYALTPGIPADFWNTWVQQKKLAEFFLPPDGAEHGMIFAYSTVESTRDAAREQTKLLSGLEPMSTARDSKGNLTDPRIPRPITMNVGKLQPERAPGVEGEAASINQPA